MGQGGSRVGGICRRDLAFPRAPGSPQHPSLSSTNSPIPNLCSLSTPYWLLPIPCLSAPSLPASFTSPAPSAPAQTRTEEPAPRSRQSQKPRAPSRIRAAAAAQTRCPPKARRSAFRAGRPRPETGCAPAGGESSFRCAGITPNTPCTPNCITNAPAASAAADAPNAHAGSATSATHSATMMLHRRPIFCERCPIASAPAIAPTL